MNTLPDLAAIEAAARIVHGILPPTPQYQWPLLSERLGAETWVKHENQTPVGAFKIRGGLVYFDHLAAGGALPAGVISATRGNHGQSVAFAASRHGIRSVIVVPHGNSREKNHAMRALGAELVEHGDDFQESLEYAMQMAEEQDLHFVPSFHPLLIAGVATYCLEFFTAAPRLDTVYVPIGLGSGICAMMAARDALGLETRIVGVVSSHAMAYADSIQLGQPVDRRVTTELADGMACRSPQPDALKFIGDGADRILDVSDDEIAEAMRIVYETTHQVAEGAGAAAIAAALQDKETIAAQRVGVVLTGGNVDRDVYARVLSG